MTTAEERWTSYQKGVVALAALAIVFDGFDNQVLGFATPSLIKEWGITKGDMAPVAAIGLFGMTVGTMIAGVLGDRFGRRTMLIVSVALFGAMTLAIGFVDGLWQLGALRFLSGLGLGGAMPNATTIAAEYTPPKKRALAVTLTIVCIPLGGLVAGLISRTILPDMGWRALFFVAGGLPLLVALILFLALPESPSFGTDGSARQKAKLADLFGPGIVRDTLALWSAFFACLLAVYSVFSWTPTMLTEAGFAPTTASDGLSAFNFGGIGGAVLAAWFIMAIGSRRSLITLCAVAVIVAAVSAVWVVGSTDAARAVLAFGILGFAINGVQTTLFAVAAHVYPDAIRATGVGAALGIGRLGAVLSTFLGAAALSNGGGSGYFALIAGAMAITLVALAILSRHIPRSAEL